MKLVKLPNDVIVNLEQLTRAEYSDNGKSISLYFSDADIENKVAYFGDDAERVWSYLVKQSYVLV